MESNGFNLISYLIQFISAENIWGLLSTVGFASAIQAWVSTKSKAKNPILRVIDQVVRDLVNIAALNVGKAKNADDDR